MASEDFQRIVESLRIAVAIADSGGIVAFANPAFAQLADMPGKPAAGSSLPSLFHPGDAKRVHQNVARIAEGKTASALLDVLSYEGSIPDADIPPLGVVSLVEGQATPVLDDGVMPGGMCRLPNGGDTNDALTDWQQCAALTPGAANLP